MNVKKVIGYSAIALTMFFSIFIFVTLDVINSYPPGAIITLFGLTATRQEWFQNIFLIGIVCLLLPMSILTGYIAGQYNLDPIKVIILIVTMLVIGSALWDVLFIQLFVIPNAIDPTTLLPWFDFFGIGALKIAEVSLNMFKIESGIVWMDSEFMILFSYIRLLIFIPALLIEIWRFSK